MQTRRRRKGAMAVEYGLIVALLAVAILTAVGASGSAVSTLFADLAERLTPEPGSSDENAAPGNPPPAVPGAQWVASSWRQMSACGHDADDNPVTAYWWRTVTCEDGGVAVPEDRCQGAQPARLDSRPCQQTTCGAFEDRVVDFANEDTLVGYGFSIADMSSLRNLCQRDGVRICTYIPGNGYSVGYIGTAITEEPGSFVRRVAICE